MKILSIGVVGPDRAGKSQLVQNFFRQSNRLQMYNATIGVDFDTHHYDFTRKKITELSELKLQVWDCGGRPEFRNIMKTYVTNREIVLCVFDTSDFESFNNLCEMMPDIMNHLSDHSIVRIVGTHCDLRHEVTRDSIASLCKRYDTHYLSCAANDLVSINHVFEAVIDSARDQCKTQQISRRYMAEDTPQPSTPCCFM